MVTLSAQINLELVSTKKKCLSLLLRFLREKQKILDFQNVNLYVIK